MKNSKGGMKTTETDSPTMWIAFSQANRKEVDRDPVLAELWKRHDKKVSYVEEKYAHEFINDDIK